MFEKLNYEQLREKEILVVVSHHTKQDYQQQCMLVNIQLN
jgi:hypothetical protein